MSDFQEIPAFVINLEKRSDRLEQFNAEFKDVKSFNITRFNAIERTPGALGCSLSHTTCLQYAIEKDYDIVCILEDDCQLTVSPEIFDKHVQNVLKTETFDVFLVGAVVYKAGEPKNGVRRIFDAQTAACYIVKKHYLKTLYDRLSSGCELLEKNLDKISIYINDQYWKLLQRTGKWIAATPLLCKQRPSYSDLENKFVNYDHPYLTTNSVYLSNPWSFFKNIYVISLAEDVEKRTRIKKMLDGFDGCTYKIFDAVNGKKNKLLRQSYEERNIISKSANLKDGQLGCLASHRTIWENELMSIKDDTPVWILIMEDDALFHPEFNNAIFSEYLMNIPKDAYYIKFSYLAIERFYKEFSISNNYWMNFNSSASFSTVCYAVRSDFLGGLLAHTFKGPLDCLAIPCSYGAINIEKLLNITENNEFRTYYNPIHNINESFHGFVAVTKGESKTCI